MERLDAERELLLERLAIVKEALAAVEAAIEKARLDDV